TGKPTFDGETLTAKLLAHQSQPIPSLRASRGDVPEQLDAVFGRMVAKRIEERYQSMSEVIADLELCAGDAPPEGDLRPAVAPSSDIGQLTFLRDIPVQTAHRPVLTKQPVAGKSSKPPTVLIVGIVGAVAVG